MAVGVAPAVTGASAAAIALTKGAMTVMFMSKVKLLLAVVLTGGAIVSGTALLGRRAMGVHQQAPSSEAKSQKASAAGTAETPNVSTWPSPERLSPISRARIDVAKKLRDNAYTTFQQGESDLATYLGAQRRYDDIVGALTAKSDVDRVRFNEIRVAGWKQVEKAVRDQFAMGQRSLNEVLAVELDRLEAEDALAKARAKLLALAGTANERLRVTKKIRDVMYAKFAGGQIAAEEYLVWQKRHDDLALAVMQITGGDKVRLCEDRLLAMKNIEQDVQRLLDGGQVQQSDIEIVRYYRLEAEEALAMEKAGARKSRASDKQGRSITASGAARQESASRSRDQAATNSSPCRVPAELDRLCR